MRAGCRLHFTVNMSQGKEMVSSGHYLINSDLIDYLILSPSDFHATSNLLIPIQLIGEFHPFFPVACLFSIFPIRHSSGTEYSKETRQAFPSVLCKPKLSKLLDSNPDAWWQCSLHALDSERGSTAGDHSLSSRLWDEPLHLHTWHVRTPKGSCSCPWCHEHLHLNNLYTK